MFRLMNTLRAEKALSNLYTPKLPSKRAVGIQYIISHITTPKIIEFGNVSCFDNILKSKDASPTAVSAARLGRAIDLLSRGMQKPALVDIDSVLTSAANDQKVDFVFFAHALRLKAHNQMLDNAVAKMMVSGAANEIEVSDLRSKVRTDIATMSKMNPNCPFVALAKAEFAVADGLYEKSIAGFDEVINTIQKKLRQSDLSVIDGDENVHPASTVAYQLQLRRKPSKDTLANARDEIGIPSSVVDEYVYGLCEVINAAIISHHMMEFFPANEEYKLWIKTPEMETTANRIFRPSEISNTGKGVPMATLETLKLEKPLNAFYGAEDELSKLLDSSEPIVPSELLRKFGSPSKITTSDDSYDHLMKSIESNMKITPSGGGHLSDDEALVQSLLQQTLYRTKVSKALALECLERIPEALELLNSVISDNKFLFMWEAFSIRGRILKAVGKYEESDKDFKTLFSLKKTSNVGTLGYDVPQCDANRTVSAF